MISIFALLALHLLEDTIDKVAPLCYRRRPMTLVCTINSRFGSDEWLFLRQGTYQIKLLPQLSSIFHINKLGNLCGRAHQFLVMCSSFNSANVIMTTADLANCTSRWSDPTWKYTNKPGLFSVDIKHYRIHGRSEKEHEHLWGKAC